MQKIAAIYRKELNTYFTSPTAYIFIMMFLVITGYFFWFILIDGRKASMRDTFNVIGSVLLFVTPMLTMRLMAEERKSGTLELIFTSPITSTELILAKFFGALTIYGLMFALTGIYPLILKMLGKPEFWPIASGYVGLAFMAGCYTAVGLLASTLTENQLVAGIISFGILLVFLVLDWLRNYFTNPALLDLLQQVSFFQHYEGFSKGVLAVPDLFYFSSLIVFVLFLSTRILEIQRNR